MLVYQKMDIHSINPRELIEHNYYTADCALSPSDAGYPMTRAITVTSEKIRITSNVTQVPPIVIPLLRVISVESFVGRHPGKFVGGCPSCKITFRTKSGVDDNVTIFTTDPKFDAGDLIKLGAHNAMLRLEKLAKNNIPFLLCPSLLKSEPGMSTENFIGQLILHLPQIRNNLSFKTKFWDASVRDKLFSNLGDHVKTLENYRIQETTAKGRKKLTIEEKLQKIKEVVWVHRRKRTEKYPSEIPDEAPKMPIIEYQYFKKALDGAGDVLLILSSLMTDLPLDQDGLTEWANSTVLDPMV